MAKSLSSFCLILLAQSVCFICVYLHMQFYMKRIVLSLHADHLILSAVFQLK